MARTPRKLPPASPPTDYHAMMREVDALPSPARSPAQQADSDGVTQCLRAAADALHARNLANGVALAQQAAGGRGPLANVFAELGRRYGHLVEGRQTPQLSRCRAITSRADFVEVLLDVAGVSGSSIARVPRRAFQVIEGGAD